MDRQAECVWHNGALRSPYGYWYPATSNAGSLKRSMAHGEGSMITLNCNIVKSCFPSTILPDCAEHSSATGKRRASLGAYDFFDFRAFAGHLNPLFSVPVFGRNQKSHKLSAQSERNPPGSVNDFGCGLQTALRWHGRPRGTGILPVREHGQDGHGTLVAATPRSGTVAVAVALSLVGRFDVEAALRRHLAR